VLILTEKLPPEVQAKLVQFQQVQEQLKIILAQKQNVQAELREVENVLAELEKLPDNIELYKNVGHILIRTSKEDVIKELNERKEILELRMKTLEKQEAYLQKQYDELRRKVTEELMKTYRAAI